MNNTPFTTKDPLLDTIRAITNTTTLEESNDKDLGHVTLHHGDKDGHFLQVGPHPKGGHYVHVSGKVKGEKGSLHATGNITQIRKGEGSAEAGDRVKKAVIDAYKTGKKSNILAAVKEHGYAHHDWRFHGNVKEEADLFESALHPKVAKKAEELRSAGHSVTYTGQGYHPKTKAKIGLIRYTDSNTDGKLAKSFPLGEEVEAVDEGKEPGYGESKFKVGQRVVSKAAGSVGHAGVITKLGDKEHEVHFALPGKKMVAHDDLRAERGAELHEISSKLAASYLEKTSRSTTREKGRKLAWNKAAATTDVKVPTTPGYFNGVFKEESSGVKPQSLTHVFVNGLPKRSQTKIEHHQDGSSTMRVYGAKQKGSPSTAKMADEHLKYMYDNGATGVEHGNKEDALTNKKFKTESHYGKMTVHVTKEADHHKIHVAPHKKLKEETELNELSKGTLGRYINTATSGMRGVGISMHQAGIAGATGDTDKERKYYDKGVKRAAGIKAAVKKLTKEEEEFLNALDINESQTQLSSQQDQLLRAMAKDPSEIMKMRKALLAGEKGLQNPTLRAEVLKMLDGMMGVTLGDKTTFNKTRQLFIKRKATDTTQTEEVEVPKGIKSVADLNQLHLKHSKAAIYHRNNGNRAGAIAHSKQAETIEGISTRGGYWSKDGKQNQASVLAKSEATFKAHPHNTSTNEEVEQIDELSKKTLGSYINKSKDKEQALRSKGDLIGGIQTMGKRLGAEIRHDHHVLPVNSGKYTHYTAEEAEQIGEAKKMSTAERIKRMARVSAAVSKIDAQKKKDSPEYRDSLDATAKRADDAKKAPFEGGREVKSKVSAADRVKKIAKGMKKHYTK